PLPWAISLYSRVRSRWGRASPQTVTAHRHECARTGDNVDRIRGGRGLPMPRFLRRRALTCLVVLPVLILMTACGAGASGSSARPSVTASLEPTRSFSPTRTLAPTLSPTPAAPAQSNDASAAPSPAPATDTSSENGSAGKGWWWLLAVVLIMGGIAAFLLVRRRRGLHEWEDRFSAARDGVGWFARDLLPQLRRS